MIHHLESYDDGYSEGFLAGQNSQKEEITALRKQLDEHRNILSKIKINDKGEWADGSYYQLLEEKYFKVLNGEDKEKMEMLIKEVELKAKKSQKEDEIEWLKDKIEHYDIYNIKEKLKARLKLKSVELTKPLPVYRVVKSG